MLNVSNYFKNGIRTEKNFGLEKGFISSFALSGEELQVFNSKLTDYVCENAANISKSLADELCEVGLAKLHKVIDDNYHAELLGKMNRIVPAELVSYLKSTECFQNFGELFGDYFLSDEENIGREQICFRIVRPQKEKDVGSWHKDRWFWDHYRFDTQVKAGRVKAWSQLIGEPELSGLRFMPGSHLMEIKYQAVEQSGKLKFLPEKIGDSQESYQFSGKLGEFVLFNYDVLHVGAKNQGLDCRVSIETTFCFNEDK